MKKLAGIAGMLIAALSVQAQTTSQPANEAIRKGNGLYRQQQYQEAEAAYAEALEKQPSSITAKFNRANALARQSKNTEAAKAYENVVMDAGTAALKANGYYNKGVILSGQQKLEESIEAYKNALRQNPADQQARENLQKALLEQKKNKKPDQQKQDNKKQQQKQQQQPQPRMSQKEAQQRLKLLEQKEKELQQRMQKSKSQTGGGQTKDW
ncbi:MAG TPA: tetratricopeptide repeat protein [Chitinophagaceae bacterium]|nr:tetratricopeptide repeat protein [Chitinophagaceae bacterium]